MTLGVATLGAVVSALNGAGPIEIAPALEPRPAYLALGGEMVEMAAETYGTGCFVPMLDEIRRHPRWSIRLDYVQWDWNGADNHSSRRVAALVIDGETATWRDGTLPRSLTLTEAERRDVLAAFALDCRVDESRLGCGNGGRYVGVALGEDGPLVARFPESSSIKLRLQELFHAIHARHIAGRIEDLSGFSLELERTARTGHDRQGQPIRKRHRFVFRDEDAADVELAYRVDLLDWAMTQPVSLPPGARVVSGTLRAYGTSRPIAVDLAKLDDWARDSYGLFRALLDWEEESERP
ncbi:MAG TPA: hypothetical protein VNO30_43365 [Kofleriaceae bacterium]|nr:hypothetical protein [Kofleriaceae bacterium]